MAKVFSGSSVGLALGLALVAGCGREAPSGAPSAASTASVPPTNPSSAPKAPQIVHIAAGFERTCAIQRAAEGAPGSLVCWGNPLGKDAGPSAPPVFVRYPGDITSIVLGEEHACSVSVDGSVQCWGWDWTGAVGSKV